MNIEDSKDPWNQGQKQVSVKVPGWLSALTLIVKVPFRLVFGTIGLLLGGARAIDNAIAPNSTQNSANEDLKLDHRYNWDGTVNTDGDVTSGK